MNHRILILAALIATTACSAAQKRAGHDSSAQTPTTSEPQGAALKYPETRREQIVETIFGTEVADPYRWLENVEDKEVQSWMDAQDEVARNFLAALPNRDRLAERFAELYYVDSMSAPVHRGGRYFYTRRHADKEKAVYYWKEGAEGEERVLLDPNQLSEDGSISVGRGKASWDGKKFAYSLKENNADEATLYVMDVESGEISDVDVIPGAKYADPQWTPQNDGFYYTKLPVDPEIPVAERPGHAHVRFHRLGTDPKDDPVVHEEIGDPKKFVGVSLSRDGRYLFYYVWHGWNSSDVYYRDLTKKKMDWTPIVVGKPFNYAIVPWKDHFYVLTNEDAPRYRVFKVAADDPKRENWQELVGELEDGAVIDDLQIIGGRIVLTLIRDVHSDLHVYDFDGKLVRDIELPGIGATFGMTGNPDEDDAYFSFQSFTIPPRIYKTSIASGATELWAKVEVPIDPEPYRVEQVWFESRDGTRVPMFVITRKDAPRDGSTPFLLYGYGGFNVNMRPYFRASIYPWLEAGGGYAVPNLRGGGEFGEDWHKAGMLDRKQNVFDDFIAAAEFLVDNGYTAPERLAIKGGSNGGLLVGAAMTQRPDLFGAVVCSVPLLDMIRYHKFGSGQTWIAEYGSPDKEEDFQYLYAYSPYHRVEKTDYPALLMLAADSDDRVDPMHARKFVAAVQHADTGDEPILLRIERNAGHGGADLIKQYVAEDADVYAFLMRVLGVESH